MKTRIIKNTAVPLVVALSCVSNSANAGWLDSVMGIAGEALASYEGPVASANEQLSAAEMQQAAGEVLALGTARTVARLGALSGFYRDGAVRLGLPLQWERARASAERTGYSADFDRLELLLNRAAEAAVPGIEEQLGTLPTAVPMGEPRLLLLRGGDALTRQLEQHYRVQMHEALVPLVREQLHAVGALTSHRQLASRIAGLPDDAETALAGYVAEHCIRGFFHYFEKEERYIRSEPEYRTTALLRKVFGHYPG